MESEVQDESKLEFNLLMGCTGSVASLKIPLLLKEIHDYSAVKNVIVHARLIPTKHSTHFFDLSAVKLHPLLQGVVSFHSHPDAVNSDSHLEHAVNSHPRLRGVFMDEDEWTSWQSRGDPVLHIELRKWADALLIAPLGTNTLAKLATGICDNLLTCVVRAWDIKACREGRKPVMFAPAMNTCMWNHPVTEEQIRKLASFGFEEIPPIEKMLASGDEGAGAMEECRHIAEKIVDRLLILKRLNG